MVPRFILLILPFILPFLLFSTVSFAVLDDYGAFSLEKYSQSRAAFPWHWHKPKSKTESEKATHQNGGTEFVTIRISGGSLRGTVSYEAGQDKPAFLFKGVPMAEPPVGRLRFRPLQEKGPWGDVWDATKYSPACLSNTTRTRSPQHYISEDCIYMNVFSSPKCMEKPCPVLFYVHGGGFTYDSATMFNDSQIVRKYASDGIVFLIPAYRLGVFGFLDMGNDRTVKRNLGMHDIVFALEWTQREVYAFGGDPNRVTVMGNSAGGSAVSYLCSSPALTENHFRQAIISSSVPTFTNDTNLLQSKALLAHFNCSRSVNDSQRPFSDWQSAECLRRVDSLELLRQQQINEEESNLIFAGPETDTELLPAKSYAELLRHWKELPIMKMTTTLELPYVADEKLWGECANDCAMFNYWSQETLQKCVQRYNGTFSEETTPLIGMAQPFFLIYSREWDGKMCAKHCKMSQHFLTQKMAWPKRNDLVVPLRLISMTTKNEYEGPASYNKEFADKNVDLGFECAKSLYSLGYLSSAARDACIGRYNGTFYSEENMRISSESMHAEAFLTALVNTREGGQSFVGEFEVANYSNHANDMYFFIGLHQIPLNRLDLQLMDLYYPQMIKNFVNGKAPDIAWKPQNWNGRNYFRITFNASENGTLLLDWPHGVDAYQDVAGLDFWLREMPQVEQNATRETEEEDKQQIWQEDELQIWQRVFVPKGWRRDGERGGQGKKKETENGTQSQQTKPITRLYGMAFKTKPLPEMLSMPSDEDNDGTPTDGGEEEDGTNQKAIAIHQNGELASAAAGELHRVWAAFWLTLTVAVLLAVVLFLLMVKRSRNGPYAHSSNKSLGDSEFCTEKSRIYVANDANAMRYS